MSEVASRRSLPKRIFLVIAGLLAFTVLFVLARRIAVQEISAGVAQSRANGLAASSWDIHSAMISSSSTPAAAFSREPGLWISRGADLRTRSAAFDHSVEARHQVVSAHHGYFEELRTETRPGQGRALSAAISVPSSDFDAALADFKKVVQVEQISEAGEDAAVKIESAERHLSAAQANLSRLQRLPRERKGGLRDALALEREMAQADELVSEAQRQQEDLLSGVSRAHIHITLTEQFRPPLEANLSGAIFGLRNSLVERVSAIFSSASICLGALVEFGLPILFWVALLFWPSRVAWRRYHGNPAAATAAR
jgi:Domain of unknown function (DUF4349)